MEPKLKPLEVVAISVLLALWSLINRANAMPQVPCYFIFGDSLSDNGNNNNLPTLARVNYEPYGIDFPQGPTGRFSNGRNMQDFVVQLLGFQQYMPPFAHSVGTNITNGVNYASGSAGILDETGRNLGARISFNHQIINHKIIISRIRLSMRNKTATNSLLRRCIYSVQIGSNDYINNYFRPESYTTSRRFTLPEYATALIQQLSLQLKRLYENGARKFAVYGLGLLGCTPDAISRYGTNGSLCVDRLNEAATLFNDRLKPLIAQLNTNLTDAKFTYLNPTGTQADLATFVTNSSCCITGGGGGELCLRNSQPCSMRSQYLFFDGVHTSEAWNEIIARSAYASNSQLQASPLPGSNFLPSSGSSRRAAIPSSHDPAAMTVGDSEPPRLRTIDASAGSFQKISSGQRNSSILSENKRQSSGRNSLNVKNLESALRGIESLHFSNDERPHY